MNKAYFRKLLASFICGSSFIYFTAVTFCPIPQANIGNSKSILGFLFGSAVGLIIGFYYGDSEK